MKKLLVCSAFLFLSAMAFAQGNLSYIWSYLTPPSKAEAWGVDVDNSGNVLWAVSSANTSVDLNITGYKFDTNGNILWNPLPVVADLGNEKAFIVKATDSVLYIGGHHCPPLGFGINCPLMLVKLNATTGAYIDSFAYKYNTTFGYNEVDDIHLFSDGILLSGWAQTAGSAYQIEMGFMKITHDMNSVIWQNTFGQPNTAEHQDGHIFIDSDTIYACGMWGGMGIANLYDGNAMLTKFNLNGAVFIDSALFGNSSTSFLNLENALGMTSVGNKLYVTGYTTVAANDVQIFVACFDKNLNRLWTHDWGGSDFESARAIQVSNGFVYVGGQSNSSSISSTGYDGVLLKYDTAGNFISYKKYSTPGNDEIRDMKIDGSNIYLSGASSLSDTTNQTEIAFLVKCDLSQFTLINDSDVESINVSLIQNPVTDYAFLKFNQRIPQHLSVSIYDQMGRQIKQGEIEIISNESELKISFSKFKQGVYILQVESDKGNFTQKLIKL